MRSEREMSDSYGLDLRNGASRVGVSGCTSYRMQRTSMTLDKDDVFYSQLILINELNVIV
jgi:hypothetical protein